MIGSLFRAGPLALVVLCIGLGPARAADKPAADLGQLSLDTLLDMPVTGASRFVQRRSHAASAVTVVTREEIAALGHRTLADVLRSVRGVAVTTDRVYQYLGVRGVLSSGDYNTRVLLLVDGNRVNDALYDQALLGDEFPLDLALVERVEFIPGQGSALYGGNALFGVINVITREAPRQAQGHARVAAGAAGERDLHLQLRVPLAAGGLQLQASRQRRQGNDFFDPAQAGVAGSDGWSRGADGSRRNAVALRLDLGGLTASLVHADRQKGLPLAVDLIWGDTRSHYRDRSTLFNLEGSVALGEATRATARAFVGSYRFSADYAIDYPPPTINRDQARADWRGVEARLSHTGWRGHRVVAGVELQQMPRLQQSNADIEPAPALYLDDQRRGHRLAVYTEDQWALADGWELHLGARTDRQRGQPDTTSPRVALVWQPDAAWSIKAIHGRAFRAPNAYEAHYVIDAPAGYQANPGLRSERVLGSELVAEWRPQPEWRLTGSLFANRAQHLVVLDYDAGIDRYRFGNADEVKARGGEIEVEHAQAATRWRLNYSWAGLRGAESAASVYPARMLKGVLMLPLRADWVLGLEGQALGRRGAAPGLALFNTTLHGPLWDGGPVLTLALRNLADRRGFDPGSDPLRQPVLPLPGREARVELGWSLP